jgi:ketosteroid isomerase-like protein
MKYTIRLLFVISLWPVATLAQDSKDIIIKIMESQQACWNKGDLECFMIGYWNSDSLMFIGKDTVYYGFESTLKRYQNSYPNKESMGQLRFEFLSLQKLSPTSYFMVGKYHLTRSIGNLAGHFTLLWRKIDGEWVIVADHSS